MLQNNTQTLRQWIGDESIWGAIKSGQDFPFIGSDAGELDLMLSINYGSRNMFTGFNGISVTVAAGQIIKLYSDKWNKLYNFQNTIDNIGATSSRKSGGNTIVNTHKLGDGENINSTAAFNSPDMVKDTSTDYNNQETITEDTQKDSTDETFSIKAAFENLPLVERTNIINIVLKDVATYLTTSIY